MENYSCLAENPPGILNVREESTAGNNVSHEVLDVLFNMLAALGLDEKVVTRKAARLLQNAGEQV